MILLVYGLVFFNVCRCLHLPGLEALTEDEKTDVSDDLSSIFPNYRSGIPSPRIDKPGDLLPASFVLALNHKHSTTPLPTTTEIPTTSTATSTSFKSTTGPLVSLLNRIFGGDGWRALLKQSKVNNQLTTTSVVQPSNHKDNEGAQFQGFQSYQVSANNNPKSFVEQEHVGNKSETNYSATMEYNGKFSDNGESLGTQGFDSVTKRPFQFYSPFSAGQTQDPSMVQEHTGHYSEGFMTAPISNEWFGSSAFDPDKVNSQAGLYDPNSAFDSFVTQTGSNKENAHLSTSFNANAVNQKYMQNGGFQFPPGLDNTALTEKEIQHSSDKNQYGSEMIFDADSLNTFLMNKMFASANNNMHQSRIQDAQVLSSFENTKHDDYQNVSPGARLPVTQQLKTHEESVKQQTHKSAGSHADAKIPTPPAEKSPLQFSFIPGLLSSGSSSHSHQYSRPSFLSSLEDSQTAPLFDPNAINAAQAMYNPNANSWLSPGHKRNVLYEVEDVVVTNKSEVGNLTGTTLLKNLSFSPSVSEARIKMNVTSVPDTTTHTVYLGFDPNVLNAQQGQSNFVPGQIAPHFYDGTGQNGFQGNNPGPSVDYMNPFNQDTNKAPGMNFDIQSLLGFGTTRKNSTSSGFSGGSLDWNEGGFNPDKVNMNFVNMFGNDTNLGFGMNGIGSSWLSTGNDPFVSNPDARVLNDSDSFQMYGYGMSFGSSGFDANAVNMPMNSYSGESNSSASGSFGTGFGAFAGFPAMSSGGYGAMIYDANQVNQQLIQNLLGDQARNATGNGMDYFLGISKGGHHSGAGSSYQSAFISSFDPSSVNKAVYDPNKYNNVHINFDPLEMLSKNPGIDKATLQSASFDPDKANSEYTHINFSPVGMIAGSLGLNTTVLNGATFNPSSLGQASFIPSQIGVPYTQSSSNQPNGSQPVFDPVGIMRQLMQDSNSFIPGTSGSQHMNFDPSSIFQQPSQTSSSAGPVTQPQVMKPKQQIYTRATGATSSVKPTSTIVPTQTVSLETSTASVVTSFSTTVSPTSNSTSP